MIINTDTGMVNQIIKLERYINELEPNRYTITQFIIDGKTFYRVYDHKKKHEVKPTRKNRWSLQHADGKFWLYSIKPIIRMIYDDEYCIDDIPDQNDGVHGREIWCFLDDKYIGALQNARQTYLVSNYGRYKSYTGYHAKIVPQFENEYGYLNVYFRRKGETLKLRVHRPVAYYYLAEDEESFNKMDVHHKASKTENQAWNLVICDKKLHRELDKAKRAAAKAAEPIAA